MSLSLEDVKKVSTLARLKFSEERLMAMKQELQDVLQWIDQLQKVDTSTVDVFSYQQKLVMPEREDVVCDGNKANMILASAPDQKYDLFVVPKVVE